MYPCCDHSEKLETDEQRLTCQSVKHWDIFTLSRLQSVEDKDSWRKIRSKYAIVMTVIEGLLPVLSPAVTLTLWDRRDMHASGNVILRVLHNSRCLKYPLPVPWRKVLWSRKGAFWMQYYRQENSIIESSLNWELKRKKFEFLSVPIKFVLATPILVTIQGRYMP